MTDLVTISPRKTARANSEISEIGESTRKVAEKLQPVSHYDKSSIETSRINATDGKAKKPLFETSVIMKSALVIDGVGRGAVKAYIGGWAAYGAMQVAGWGLKHYGFSAAATIIASPVLFKILVVTGGAYGIYRFYKAITDTSEGDLYFTNLGERTGELTVAASWLKIPVPRLSARPGRSASVDSTRAIAAAEKSRRLLAPDRLAERESMFGPFKTKFKPQPEMSDSAPILERPYDLQPTPRVFGRDVEWIEPGLKDSDGRFIVLSFPLNNGRLLKLSALMRANPAYWRALGFTVQIPNSGSIAIKIRAPEFLKAAKEYTPIFPNDPNLQLTLLPREPATPSTRHDLYNSFIGGQFDRSNTSDALLFEPSVLNMPRDLYLACAAKLDAIDKILKVLGDINIRSSEEFRRGLEPRFKQFEKVREQLIIMISMGAPVLTEKLLDQTEKFLVTKSEASRSAIIRGARVLQDNASESAFTHWRVVQDMVDADFYASNRGVLSDKLKDYSAITGVDLSEKAFDDVRNELDNKLPELPVRQRVKNMHAEIESRVRLMLGLDSILKPKK